MSSGKSFRPMKTREFETDETADKSFRPIITTADKSFRPIITTADKSFRPIIITDEAADKFFRPITRNEFETDDEADKEVQNIISGHEDEERQARQAREAYALYVARTASEYHQREKDKEKGFCVTQ